MSRRSAALIAVFLIALLSLPANATETGSVASERANVATLSNGLMVVAIPNPRAPIVTHMVWYKVGAAAEQPGKSGVAHLLEHMMFRGTEKIPPGEFSKIVARHGGQDNAFTGQDYTAYFQSVAREHLELVMEMEAGRMNGLAVTEELLLPERKVVEEERRSRVDNNPAALFSEKMQAALYAGHPYAIPVIGWADEISQLALDDLLDFYRRFYIPQNAILVVAGDVSLEELLPLAEKYYGSIPSGDDSFSTSSGGEPVVSAHRVEHTDSRARQPSWSRAYLAPSARQDEGGQSKAAALEVLADILGGSTTSRLYRTLVVEKGLAAYAGAGYDGTRRGPTSLRISLVPQISTDMDKLEQAADQVIADLLANGVSKEELARSKRSLRAAAIYARDSSHGMANIYGSVLASGGEIADVESWPDIIDAVTLEDVSSAAREVLHRDRSVTGILWPDSMAKPESGAGQGSVDEKAQANE